MQCIRCKNSLDHASIQVFGSFPCPRCGASLAVDPAQLWRRRALYGIAAGVVTGVLRSNGGALFALCIALALSLCDARIGSLNIVAGRDLPSKPVWQSLWTSAAVTLCAAVPYAVLRALLK